MKNNEIRKTIQQVRQLYVPTSSFQTLENRFLDLLAQRRADEADGITSSARGIVLVGQSGAGKTRAIRQLIHTNRALLQTDTEQEVCEVIGLQIPSPATMKFVGAATLRALGYRFSGDKQGPAIWDQVKTQLKIRRTLFLHLDEAQDLARHQTDKERQAVVNTLKSLMENSIWPVSLILAGMPDLKTIVNQDPQLSRRLFPVEISRLNTIRDIDPVLDIVHKYATKARLRTGSCVKTPDFAARLLHAADYEFGLLVELIVQSVSKALAAEGFDGCLMCQNFADVYFDRSSSVGTFNPFLAEDFVRINPRRVFESGSL